MINAIRLQLTNALIQLDAQRMEKIQKEKERDVNLAYSQAGSIELWVQYTRVIS